MATLQFIKVEVLSYNHVPVFLGAGLRYRLEKRLSIRGYIKSTDPAEPAQSILDKENQILAAANDFDDILLEGISFGSGRITNISFEGGILAQDERYTYDIECYEEGNLFNADSGVYAGLSWPSAEKIESIDESFDYSEDENGDKTYNHSFSVKYRQWSSVANGIALAKALAAVFLGATSGLTSFVGNFNSLSGKRKLYTENYSIVDCSCSIQEVVTIPKDSSGNYSYGLNYQIEQDADGFVNITENVDIQGLTKPPLAGGEEGYNALKAAAYTRTNTVYLAYNFSDANLFTAPIEKSQTKNPFEGTISFTNTFTNNPKYQDGAFWERTLEISLSEDNYYVLGEQGTIRGFGRPTLDKYQNAIQFYNTNVKSPEVNDRIQDLYDTTGRVYDLFLIQNSFSKNEFDGTIEYSFQFTDDDRFSTGDIKKTELEITTANPVHLIQKYQVFNVAEIVQGQQSSSLGQRNIDIRMNGKRGTPISTYLTAAKALAAINVPIAADYFMSDVSYSFTPNQNVFSFSVSFLFVGAHKELNDLTIT